MLSPPQMLQPLGLSPLDEDVYRALLKHPSSSIEALAAIVEQDAVQVIASLARLESVGLASRSTDNDMFSASAPGPAIELLVRRREEELGEVRVAAAELEREYRQATPDRQQLTGIVEVVVGAHAVTQRFDQLQSGAQESFWAMVKPPWIRRQNPLQHELMKRGVRYRAVYDATCLSNEQEIEWIQRDAALGEQARIFDGVPFKLAGIDDSNAMIPLAPNDPATTEGALIISPSPILVALTSFFEGIWEKATPFGTRARPQDAGRDSDLDDDTLAILELLADGVSDQAIMRRLDISRSTLNRRVQRIISVLGARTRFHAGVLARERNLLDRAPWDVTPSR